MSCLATAAWSAVAISAAATAGNMYNQHQQDKAAKESARKQAENQRIAQQQQEQDLNRANRQSADLTSILQQAGLSGGNPTSLTGPSGAGLDAGALGGGNNLLGG